MSGFIGVHAGAGVHSVAQSHTYKKLCRDACRKAVEVLNADGSAIDAVTAATKVLEDSPLTNAGQGSNLTWDGTVECDACVMEGTSLSWGGVGAVPGIRNPVALAKNICEKQTGPALSMGRIPPCLLVGEGARLWAVEAGIPTVDPETLITEKAAKMHRHYKKKLSRAQEKSQALLSPLDTVGAVCIDKEGYVAAASSSGGIVLKHRGRVGQAAMYGCGCWAQNGQGGSGSVATSTSGCGEYLTRTMLAREAALDVQAAPCASTGLHKAMVQKFLESPFLADKNDRFGGVIAIKHGEEGIGEFLWSHTTESLCVGYMSSNDTQPKSHISRLPRGIAPGTKAVVEGVGFCLDTSGDDDMNSKCDSNNKT